MTDFIQILTTVEKREDAEKIARALVERRLAACVQIVGPIVSIYRWRKKIERAEEFQCWIKTRAGLYPQVEAAVRQLHSYEVPEILALPILDGGKDYLAWLEDSVAHSPT
ncbi:MAG: divalent-cation tolerance protein CutA [Pirellulales bacterium]|nr:divalent-cation tolerance protein CutA [Pirellulales bacterium]